MGTCGSTLTATTGTTGTTAACRYTAFAELINEEYGGHILPGLKPLCGAPASKGKGGGMTTSSVSA